MNVNRLNRGFGWGVVATLAMSAVMIAGQLTGLAPMPKPIPVAIIGSILGDEAAKPLVMGLAIAAHLAYGGFWGAVLARVTQPVTIWKGLVMGIFLWIIMQLVVLPWIGWGAFGMEITPAIGAVTLILHLVYGATLGWLVDRKAVYSGHLHGGMERPSR